MVHLFHIRFLPPHRKTSPLEQIWDSADSSQLRDWLYDTAESLVLNWDVDLREWLYDIAESLVLNWDVDLRGQRSD